MREDKLSPGQWGALLWAAALAPATELLPGVALDMGGRGAWLTPAAGLVILMPLLWAGRGGGVEELGRRWWGRGVLALCAGWMWLLLAMRLTLCARRMLWSGERDGAVWYFLLTLAALALWMTQGKTAALGRAGQLYLALLLGAAALVLGLSLTRVRVDRVLPLWTGDAAPVLLGGIGAAGGLCWGVLPLLILPARERRGRDVLLRGGGGALLLALAQFIVLGNLGVGLAARSDSAFFALTKSVGVEGAFQRVESVVTALWMVADLTLCVVLARGVGEICRGKVLGYHITKEGAGSFALLTAAGGALWLLRRGIGLEEWSRDWVWLGNLGVCALSAGGMAIVKKTKTG